MPDEFCDGPRDEPELGPARPKIALSLSGGGFRATFFHLGVVACLRDAQLLSDVKVITSVSGGSILAGHLAVNWDSYAGSPEEFEKAATKLVQFAGSDLRNKILRTWMLALVTFVLTFGRWMPSSRKVTSILQKQYGQLYGDADLRMLGPTLASPNKPRFHVLATSMTSGDLCSFAADGLWIDSDSQVHHVKNRTLPISLAVTASSAFPPLFPPVKVTRELLDASVKEFPHEMDCLTDGGVYDNLGIRKLLRLSSTRQESFDIAILSDASADFDWETQNDYSFVIARTVRTTDILMKRISEFESDPKGTVGKLGPAGSISVSIRDVADHEQSFTPLEFDIQRKVGRIRTDLDRFTDVELQVLIQHGYAATRKAILARSEVLSDSGRKSLQSIDTPWRPSSLKRGNDALTSISAHLIKSRERKYRLWSPSDPASWLLLLILLSPLAVFYLPYRQQAQDVAQLGRRVEFANAETALARQLPNPPAPTSPVTGSVLSVYFATNRQKDESANHQWPQYGTSRGELQFGVASVNIPKNHRFGEIETPSWLGNLAGAAPKDFVSVSQISALPRTDFLRAISEACKSNKPPIVYVPGYNTTFDGALRIGGVFSFDTNASGTALVYSWPSSDRVAGYFVDRNNVEASIRYFSDAMELIVLACQGKKIDIVANGVGAILPVGWIPRRDSVAAKFVRNLVLVLPDLDAESFRSVGAQLVQSADRVTIYRSADSAVQAMSQLAGGARLGDVKSIPVLPSQIDYVDLKSDGSLLGLNFSAPTPDMFFLFYTDKGAAQRPGLRALPSGAWERRQ